MRGRVETKKTHQRIAPKQRASILFSRQGYAVLSAPSLLPVHRQLPNGSALVQLMRVGCAGLARAINRELLLYDGAKATSTTLLKTRVVENLRTVENRQDIDPVVRHPINQPVVALQYFSNFITSKFGYHLT